MRYTNISPPLSFFTVRPPYDAYITQKTPEDYADTKQRNGQRGLETTWNNNTFHLFTCSPSTTFLKKFLRPLLPSRPLEKSTRNAKRTFYHIPCFQTLRCFEHQDPVVRTPVSANPGLNFNPSFFIFLSKALSRIIFSILFRVSNYQIVGKEN